MLGIEDITTPKRDKVFALMELIVDSNAFGGSNVLTNPLSWKII